MLMRTSILYLAMLTALPAQTLPEPKNWTAAEDHRNMMEQLGIKALRPGPSGNENAPNHANYDETLANPYPQLPDALTLKNGKKVASAKVCGTSDARKLSRTSNVKCWGACRRIRRK